MKKYIIEEGDTIASIAKKLGVRVVDLVRINRLENVYELTPGDVLLIPDINKSYPFEYYVVKKGDNLYQIGLKYNIDPDLLAELNGLELNEYLYPEQKLLVPKKDVKIYITKEGDTLNYISDDLGVPRESILLYNQNIYLLPGQLIAYSVFDGNKLT